MSRTQLTISYDGDALRDGVMDVRDLAPALLAVGQLFDAANTVLNREQTEIKVQVRATGAACFSIDLQVVQNLLHQVTHFLAGEEVTSAINLKELIFGIGVPSGIGLFWLIRKLRGRSPKSVERQEAGSARIVTEDGETFDVPLAAVKLFGDIAVRAAVDRMIAEPLRKEGIDRFEAFSPVEASSVVVEKDEAVYFERPQVPDEMLVETRQRAAYSIIALAFKEDNKWRLSDGTLQISARIEDEIFLEKVERNQIAFAKGDILICDVRVTASHTPTGLKTEYVVEKVVEHRPAMRQLRLFD